MNSNIINVILIKNVIKKGTLMKEATNISSDMKYLLTLGNSVSSLNCMLNQVKRMMEVSEWIQISP